MDDKRLQWAPLSAFDRTVNDCLYEVENTNTYPWQVIWYIIRILIPDTATRMDPHISYSSAMIAILQHKIDSEPLKISLESFPILLQCLSGKSFFHALKACTEDCSAALRDLFVEARLGIINLLWKQTDERAFFLLYEFIIQVLTTHSNLSLDEICKLLFIPEATLDTTIFAQFLLEIGEILSPNLSSIDTKERLIKTALLRSVFSHTLLLYAATPLSPLKAIICSDLFLATCLPYQFISPVYFSLSICNLLRDPGTLSLSMRTTIGELVLESLNFELTSALSLTALSNIIEEGSRASTTRCSDLVESAQALLSSEVLSLDESLEQSLTLLAISAFPCMPDYTASMTHLSAPFVELSILMKDFDLKLRASDTQSDQLFAISIPAPLMGSATELLSKRFSTSASQNIWHQAALLAACFQIVAGRPRLEPYGRASGIDLPNLSIEVLTTFLGGLFTDESDAVPSALVNLSLSTFLYNLHSPTHQQAIGTLYYSQASPRFGRINGIKLWNLLLFNNVNLSCIRPLTLVDNNILSPSGKTAAELLSFMLSSTLSDTKGSSHWCATWIRYLLDITNMVLKKTWTDSLSSEVPVFLIFSFTLSLQYLSHVSTISKMQPNNATGEASNDVATVDTFVAYISSTWTLHTSPSISAILLIDTYSCDFHDDGLVALSTLSALHTLYPILTQADLAFYNRTGLSFLGTGKSVIEFYKRGTVSPLLVIFSLLYIIAPDAFPPINSLVGYLLAFSLCPTYQTAIPLLSSISPGCLGTYLMTQESLILSLMYDLQTRSSSGNRAVTSNTKQRLWRTLDKYIISIHCMTFYVSLLVYISTYELSFLRVDQLTTSTSNDGDVIGKNIRSLLLQHLVSISVTHFTTIATSKRISLTLKGYVAKLPALFLEIGDSFLDRLYCSSATMGNLISSFQNAWLSSPFIKATIGSSSFFISLLCLDVRQYLEAKTSIPGCLELTDFPESFILSIETVTASGARLSNDSVSNGSIDLLLTIFFIAYNTGYTSRLLTDAWIGEAAGSENDNNRYASVKPFFAQLYQIQVEHCVLQLFTYISQANILLPVKLSKHHWSMEQSSQQSEPSVKKQEPSTHAPSTSYTTNRYLLYIHLADIIASICTRIATLYAHKHEWPQNKALIQAVMSVLSKISRTLASVDKLLVDTYLHQEQHSLPPRLQELLCCTSSSPYTSKDVVTRMRLFCNVPLIENLLALTIPIGEHVSYITMYCNAWRLLLCAAWIASSNTKGTDYGHIPTLTILHHSGLTMYTYCLLRGFLLTKARRSKISVQAALRSFSQRCTSLKHHLSQVPFYIPGWQPIFSSAISTLLIASSSVLRTNLATLSPVDIPPALIEFSGVLQCPDGNIIEALNNALSTEEGSGNDG